MVGLQAAVLQCVPKHVSFSVEIPTCRPLPRFKDLTISTNGWELTPFVEYYWHTDFVNFMGKSHAFSNVSLVPVFPSIQIQGRKLVDIHRFEADNSLQGPLYGCANGAAAHTHFSPGAAKARKMTFFLGKNFQSRGKKCGGGRPERALHTLKKYLE